MNAVSRSQHLAVRPRVAPCGKMSQGACLVCRQRRSLGTGAIVGSEYSDGQVETGSGRISAATQTAKVMTALVESEEGESIRRIAESVGASRNATHRILQSLAELEFAVQDNHGRYSVGPKLIALAARVLSGSSLINAANEVMTRLVDEVGETAYLAMLLRSEGYATYIHRVESAQPLRYVQPIGVPIPLHAGAAGKAILAIAEDLDQGWTDLEKYTENTPTSTDDLRAELNGIRRRGFATSIEERVDGATGVAAAVRSRDDVVGSLTLTIPKSRMPSMGLDSLGPIVRRYADELTILVTAAGALRP